MTTKLGDFAPSADIDKSKMAAKERKGFIGGSVARALWTGNVGFDKSRWPWDNAPMSGQPILNLLRRVPYEPFTIITNSGETYKMEHP